MPKAHLWQLQVCRELTQQWPGSVLDKDVSQRKRFIHFTEKAKRIIIVIITKIKTFLCYMIRMAEVLLT